MKIDPMGFFSLVMKRDFEKAPKGAKTGFIKLLIAYLSQFMLIVDMASDEMEAEIEKFGDITHLINRPCNN